MAYGVARAVTVAASPERAFALLAAPERMSEWHRRVSSARRVFGDGGEGSIYSVHQSFLGRDQRFELTLQQASLPWVLVAGRSQRGELTETYTVRAMGTGSEITISAVYAFSGLTGTFQRFIERGIEKDWNASCVALAALLGHDG